MKFYENTTQTDWFSENQNPWKSVYEKDDISYICKILKLNNKTHIHMLHFNLYRLSERYMFLFNEATLPESSEDDPYTNTDWKGITYQAKARWLKENVLQPSSKLLEALNHKYKTYFSIFPNIASEGLPEYPLMYKLEKDISNLSIWTEAIIKQLTNNVNLKVEKSQYKLASRMISDLKYALVYDLLLLYVKIPKCKLEKDMKFSSVKRKPTVSSQSDGKKQMKGSEFTSFVIHAAKPILGYEDPLTDQIATAIRKWNDTLSNRFNT